MQSARLPGKYDIEKDSHSLWYRWMQRDQTQHELFDASQVNLIDVAHQYPRGCYGSDVQKRKIVAAREMYRIFESTSRRTKRKVHAPARIASLRNNTGTAT